MSSIADNRQIFIELHDGRVFLKLIEGTSRILAISR